MPFYQCPAAAKGQFYHRRHGYRPQGIGEPVPYIAVPAGNKVLVDLVNKAV
jgi:hypothetical protein